MPSASDYLAEPPLFLILAMGPPNSGKSDLAMTFPACYVGSFDPGGFQILKNKSERAQRLAKNLRYIENFNPRGDSEMKRLYARTKPALRPEEIKPGHPQQNGRHERMHLTLKKETTKPAGLNFLQQQARFDDFIEIFNQERPHEALGMKCPAEVYQP